MTFALNPQFNWQRYGGNALQDIGVGMTQAPTIFGGLAAGAQRNAALQPERDQQLTLEEERKKAAAEKNQTSAWIAANFPQYGNLPPAQAWQAALGELEAKRNAANGTPVDPLDTYDGRVRLGQEQGLTGEALTAFSLTGKLPDAPKAPALPTSYQEYQLAQQDPNYAKTLASSTSKPPTDQDVRMQKLTEVVQPDIELLNRDAGNGKTVYDSLSDLGNQAWNGVDIFGAKPLSGMTSPEYQQAQAALQNIAQSYLYAISGQAAPAGEVAKIVDSVTPKPFESPASIVEKKRRLETYVDAIKLSKYDAAGLIKGQGPTEGYTVLSVE